MQIKNILLKHGISFREVNLRSSDEITLEQNEMCFSPLNLDETMYVVDIEELTPQILEEINNTLDIIDEDY